MVQILHDKPKGPSFSQKFSNALGVGLEGAGQLYKEHQANKLAKENEEGENETVKRLTGKDISGIKDPQLRRQLVQDLMKGEAQEKQSQSELLRKGAERQEKIMKEIAPSIQGLETIKRQRERLASGKLGPKMGGPGQSPKIFESITSEGQKIRAGYEQAGKQLIQLAATLPIRNQAEFKVLADKLYDPTLNESEIEGILDELEEHIKEAIITKGGQVDQGMQEEQPKQQKKRSLLSFYTMGR